MNEESVLCGLSQDAFEFAVTPSSKPKKVILLFGNDPNVVYGLCGNSQVETLYSLYITMEGRKCFVCLFLNDLVVCSNVH